MPMLADLADAVVGAGTHTGTHTAAIVDRLGAHLATIEVSADAAGYAQLTRFRRRALPGPADLVGSRGLRIARRRAGPCPGCCWPACP